MVKETIEKLKGIIAQSDTGHLPLSCRIELMKQVGDILTEQKIMCECCKKACSVTGRQDSDDVRLLAKINDYLYKGNGTAEDILKDTDKLRIQVENKEPASAIPAPTGIYGSEIIVDGIKWDRASDMTVCSGELEIVSSASGGYMEITFAGSRDRRDTWQHYRDAMAENMQAALVERDRVRLMIRNRPADKPLDNQPDNASPLAQACESFLTHSVNALHAGYSMGRSVRYLNGIRDFVFDTLTRCLVPDWELTEDTVFPEIKEWIVSWHGNTTAPEAKTALKELSCMSGNILIADAILKI